MPKGKYEISVCLGTACYVKGAGDIYNKFMEQLGIVGGDTDFSGGAFPDVHLILYSVTDLLQFFQ